MRAQSFVAVTVTVVATMSFEARTASARPKTANAPCGFINRNNAERCLSRLLITAASGQDTVRVGEQPSSKGSVLWRALRPGKYVVEIESAGGAVVRKEVLLRAGQLQLVHAPGAALKGPKAAPIVEGWGGFFDECDRTFVGSPQVSAVPLSPRDLARLRVDPVLAPHLPSETTLLARPEAACKAGDGPACAEAGRNYEQSIGKRDRNALKAHQFFERGCTLGHLEACASFADGLAAGAAGVYDHEGARLLREKTCGLGHAASCRKVAESVLWVKDRTPQTRAAALPLAKRSCELGDAQGCQLARSLALRVACERGDAEACELSGPQAN